MFESKDILIEKIKEHDDTIYWTVGYRWKNPTTEDVPITPQKAIEIIESGRYFCELKKRDIGLCLECFTANDMW